MRACANGIECYASGIECLCRTTVGMRKDEIPPGALELLILTNLSRRGELHGFEIVDAIERTRATCSACLRARSIPRSSGCSSRGGSAPNGA